MRTYAGLEHLEGNGPRILLADHYEKLEAAFQRLRIAQYSDDKAAIVERYRAFEQAVLAHLDAEEAVILPAYAAVEPEDAALIRSMHEDLRAQLFRLGVDVELHAMGRELLEHLIATLREHNRHESCGMCPWAAVHLPVSTRRELLRRLAHPLHHGTSNRLRDKANA